MNPVVKASLFCLVTGFALTAAAQTAEQATSPTRPESTVRSLYRKV